MTNSLDCPLELIGGKWVCPDCGWVYPLPADPNRPPSRNCPDRLRPPTLAELIERVRRDLAERVGAELSAMMPKIICRVTVCHANYCSKFDVQTCTDRGQVCTYWVRWIERLAYGTCRQWGERVDSG